MFKKGYTTIELMATLSMIAVLASVTLPSYQAVRTEANFTKAKAEVKTLQGVIERYQTLYGRLPETLDLSQMSEAANITNQNMYDAFDPGAAYSFEKGRTDTGKDYYVVFSKGENQTKDFVIAQNRVYNAGDDVIASNLLIINSK